MRVLFETSLSVVSVGGRVHTVQESARLDERPILLPSPSDGCRAQVNTVLKDGGLYRMWYLCEPPGSPATKYRIAYAESDDGVSWRRPPLGQVVDGPAGNNYLDSGVGCVFRDPSAPAECRYRGVSYAAYTADGVNCGPGIYTAHSADGLKWELDAAEPRWHTGDTFTCAYHPQRRRGAAGIKFVRPAGGIYRRAIWAAELAEGAWGDPVCALVPDEFDDISAKARGFASADFYQMGFLPSGAAWVGLVQVCRHWLPMSSTPPTPYAIYGTSDITLAYQAGPGDRWLHAPGRASFIGGDWPNWARGWLGVSTMPVDVADEQWLYVHGSSRSHAWNKNPDWTDNPRWSAHRQTEGPTMTTGLLRWPRWRMFGYAAEPEGALELDLGVLNRPAELVMNYRTGGGGALRVGLFTRAGRLDATAVAGRSDEGDIVPMRGDELSAVAAWKGGTIVPASAGRRIIARIAMEDATLYAWDWRPVS